MKLCSFNRRLQELNAYLGKFSSDTEGQETAPLSIDDIMDIPYHSMSTTWKNKIIEQGLNDIDLTVEELTNFFGT